jgi:hypothetical protein
MNRSAGRNVRAFRFDFMLRFNCRNDKFFFPTSSDSKQKTYEPTACRLAAEGLFDDRYVCAVSGGLILRINRCNFLFTNSYRAK